MINSNPIAQNQTGLETWLVDAAGNIAMSDIGLALLERIKKFVVPSFVSTEEAMAWGSELSVEQRETLLEIQRTASNAARVGRDLQETVNLATRSQLMREAAETFPELPHRKGRRTVTPSPLLANPTGSRN